MKLNTFNPEPMPGEFGTYEATCQIKDMCYQISYYGTPQQFVNTLFEENIAKDMYLQDNKNHHMNMIKEYEKMNAEMESLNEIVMFFEDKYILSNGFRAACLRKYYFKLFPFRNPDKNIVLKMRWADKWEKYNNETKTL